MAVVYRVFLLPLLLHGFIWPPGGLNNGLSADFMLCLCMPFSVTHESFSQLEVDQNA